MACTSLNQDGSSQKDSWRFVGHMAWSLLSPFDLSQILAGAIVTERYAWGVQLLTDQKPISRPGWWKGKFVLLQMPTTGGEGGRHLSKGRPPPKVVGESFYRWGWGDAWGEVTCRNSTVISNSQLQLVISGVTSIILVVLGTVNLQFHSTLISLSLQSILEIVAT